MGMKSSNFVKVSGIVLVLLALAVGGLGSSILAGPLPQATSAATSVATSASGANGAMTFPPCPPAGAATAAVLGTVDNGLATMAGTVAAATMPANPGYIGIRVEAVDNCGVRVIDVLAGSPAATAQIQVGDVVVGVNGSAVTGLESMRNAVGYLTAGAAIQLNIQRNGAESVIPITLAARPSDFPATQAAAGGAGSAAGGSSAATMAATQ